MRIVVCLCIGICLANPAWANDSFGSEFSHAIGGALVAGVSTAVADRNWPENRALIGFTVGVASAVLGELFDIHGHRTKWNGSHSGLDVASAAVGAVLGARVTDKFVLMPAVQREHGGQHQYYGVVGQYRF